jgi:hypothetical protein
MRPAPLIFALCSTVPLATFAQAQDPALSAGGLAPPPAVEGQGGAEGMAGAPGAAGESNPDQSLAEADREDSGRGLEFAWLNGEFGVTHIGLHTFSTRNLTSPNQFKPRGTGYMVGGGLGARIIFFTAGARFRYSVVPHAFRSWSLGGEGTVHFPFGSLEPYAGLGVGYTRFFELNHVTAGGVFPPQPVFRDPSGLHARLLGGADYYLTNMFSVGANVSAELLMLWRKATPGAPLGDLAGTSGRSVGGAVSATAVAGLHF